jgi:hypothetical protein
VSSSVRRCLLVAATAGSVITASVAVAATQQKYSQKFTTKHPGVSTGLTFSATSSDPTGAIPASAKTVVLTFPAGTRINTGALPKCKTKVCPAKSKIGVGQATVLLGTVPQKLAVAAYNRAGGMVLVVNNPVGTPVVMKPVLAGSKLTIQVPQLKISGISLTLVHLALTVKPIGVGAKAYVKTPASCPKGGSWTFAARFTYVGGSPPIALTSASPCSAH